VITELICAKISSKIKINSLHKGHLKYSCRNLTSLISGGYDQILLKIVLLVEIFIESIQQKKQA
jgi:hypothetical protein